MKRGCAVLKVLLDDAPDLADLEAQYVPTHRILQRWAVSVGSGMPTEQWDDRGYSKPPPLDDITATIVDQLVMKSPEPTREFIKMYYKTPIPSVMIAGKMGYTRRKMEKMWRLALHFMKHRFESSKHLTLLHLLQFRV